jgi:hypothetical protein
MTRRRTPAIEADWTKTMVAKPGGNGYNRGSVMKIAIVGLGCAGLPLCLPFAPSRVTVVGLDIDPANEVYRQP